VSDHGQVGERRLPAEAARQSAVLPSELAVLRSTAQCGDTRPCPDCNALFRFCCRDNGVWTLEGSHDPGCRWPAHTQHVGLS
jgi:hypothetical protein